MMALKPKDAWRCGRCLEIYSTEDEARDCCPPEITPGYAYPSCGALYRNADFAATCCPEDNEEEADPSNTNHRIDPLTLEQHGQQRLPL